MIVLFLKNDLNIEFIQEGLKDTLNLKISEEIKPFHIGSVYIESIKNDELRLINYKILVLITIKFLCLYKL